MSEACIAGLSAWQIGVAIAALVYIAYVAGHAAGYNKGRRDW